MLGLNPSPFFEREGHKEFLYGAFELGVVMAIGYLGNVEILPEKLKEREESSRYRLVQHEFVMNKPFEK